MKIQHQEDKDGLRFVWNIMPATKITQGRAAIPQALHYSPLSDVSEDSILLSKPLECSRCHAFMNCFNKLNIVANKFTCCICRQVSSLPADFIKQKDSNQGWDHLPKQVHLDHSTYEFVKSKDQSTEKVAYFLVIDTTLPKDELQAVQKLVLQVIDSLPNYQRVGLLTFSKDALVYSFGSMIGTVFSFSADKNYKTSEIGDLVGVQFNKIDKISNLIPPLETSRQKLTKAIKKLKSLKSNQGYKHERQHRCLGQALNISTSLLELFPLPSRLVLLCGGPCTYGVGKMIDRDYQMQFRSIDEPIPDLSKEAFKFYKNLKKKIISKMISIDSFIFSVEEVGLMEMYDFLTCTGGLLVQHEQFQNTIFADSFRKAYLYKQHNQKHSQLQTYSQSYLQVLCSSQILLNGILGSCISSPMAQNKHKNYHISEREVGKGQTNLWLMGQISENKCLTLVFELSDSSIESQDFHLQLRTTYRPCNNPNLQVQRVTTVRRLFSNSLTTIQDSFDQEAALALLSKLAVQRSLRGQKDIRQWLDSLLCRWAAAFSSYMKGDEYSFSLKQNMKMLIQYVYHLRKFVVVRRSRVSYDELYYVSHILRNANVRDILTIIQPALLMYTLELPEAQPVTLEQKNMKQDVILVLDSYFNVIEWQGEKIGAWQSEQYHLKPEHSSFKALLQAPQEDIEFIRSSRIPSPMYYKTCPSHSKERFIKSRINPSNNQDNLNMISDDTSIQEFTRRLIQVVVNEKI